MQKELSETVEKQVEHLKGQYGENLAEVFAHPGRVAGWYVQEGEARSLYGEVDCQDLPVVYEKETTKQ